MNAQRSGEAAEDVRRGASLVVNGIGVLLLEVVAVLRTVGARELARYENVAETERAHAVAVGLVFVQLLLLAVFVACEQPLIVLPMGVNSVAFSGVRGLAVGVVEPGAMFGLLIAGRVLGNQFRGAFLFRAGLLGGLVQLGGMGVAALRPSSFGRRLQCTRTNVLLLLACVAANHGSLPQDSLYQDLYPERKNARHRLRTRRTEMTRRSSIASSIFCPSHVGALLGEYFQVNIWHVICALIHCFNNELFAHFQNVFILVWLRANTVIDGFMLTGFDSSH